MQRRGRDRQVSAIAKQRARHPSHSRSPSPLSSAESLSPRSPQSREPTPPPTLSDQVHIAYADDDIHLAKVLLLRLQGIEVTSDNDPRIAAVRDEDFDACFIPFGRLDDGLGSSNYPINTSPKSATPMPSDDDARLKAKEALWESEARRFTEERNRCAALKRRQNDSYRAATLEAERVRLIRQKEAAAAVIDLRRKRMQPTARTLNFALVPPVPAQRPQKLTYDFPFTPRRVPPSPSSPSSSRNSNSSPSSYASSSTQPIPPRRRPEPQLELEPTRSLTRVTFQQVLASMRGPLFPELLSIPSPSRGSGSGSVDRGRARRERALLDALLVAGVDLDGLAELGVRGREKGKGRAVPTRCAGCYADPAPSPSLSLSQSVPAPPSPAASTLSRAGSWLSFGSSSSSSSTSSTTSSRRSTTSSATSVSTAPSSWTSASTLLSSPNADSPKSPSLRLMGMGNWLPGGRRTASPEPERAHRHTHLCRLRHAVGSERTGTVVEVHPLAPAPTLPTSSSRKSHHMQMRRASSGGAEGEQGVAHSPGTGTGTGLPFALPLATSLTRLATLARNLQTAYVRAVVVGYGVGPGEYSSPYSAYEAEAGEYGDEADSYVYAYPAKRTDGEAKQKQKQPQRVPPVTASTLRVRKAGERAGGGAVRAFLAASPVSASPSGDAEANATVNAPVNNADADLDLAPTTPLSVLPLSSRSNSLARRSLDAYTHPPARTPLPARLPYELVFRTPLPLPRSPWAAAAAAAERASASASASTGVGGVGASTTDLRDDEAYGYGYGEDGGDADDLQRRLRPRAVPNSAFLRVKALHNSTEAGSTGAASSSYSAYSYSSAEAGSTTSMPTPSLRRPRECVLAVGVDRAGPLGARVGSGLRFVFARGVPVPGGSA
ncbi:hypothetical protein B0H16DRAFT_1684716 [Mycena metata]|uniref:Uncharacterized protein n=1 Tax=Mycena metata TaxID=1033252 RepID=A0AAD7JZL8_9AGAR|nr:hypothetical protein B0H16DRAFT_1684716 [Mycena metata]